MAKIKEEGMQENVIIEHQFIHLNVEKFSIVKWYAVI